MKRLIVIYRLPSTRPYLTVYITPIDSRDHNNLVVWLALVTTVAPQFRGHTGEVYCMLTSDDMDLLLEHFPGSEIEEIWGDW